MLKPGVAAATRRSFDILDIVCTQIICPTTESSLEDDVRTWSIVMCGLLLTPDGPGYAISTAAARLRQAAAIITVIGARPDGDIPTLTANRTECVAVIPAVNNHAASIGDLHGQGVLTCRLTDGWSAPLFVELRKARLDARVGEDERDLVLLLMDGAAIEQLLKGAISLGACRSAAGPVGRATQTSTDAQFEADVLSYARAGGFVAGVHVSEGLLAPDMIVNRAVYGHEVTARALVDGRIAAPGDAAAFLTAVRRELDRALESADVHPEQLGRPCWLGIAFVQPQGHALSQRVERKASV